MTEFFADTQAIKRFAIRVGELGRSTNDARTYASDWLAVSSTQGGEVFDNFYPSASEIIATITSALNHLHEVLWRSEAELSATADEYDKTDQENAARLDGTYSSTAPTSPAWGF